MISEKPDTIKGGEVTFLCEHTDVECKYTK